ncbi:MAG: hypothetical protein QN720_11640, partial [Nitrososphaeraceae archaeon]|nr:hypothetical protein [Nitrososphaeraceae archaeon]MDW0333596.1 hypothetical protein [Nitrososphaeraceae archaeon]
LTFRQHQQVASAMKKSFPYYYFIPVQILFVIVEDIVTLVLIIILYKINSIRMFNAQLTLRGYVICPII